MSKSSYPAHPDRAGPPATLMWALMAACVSAMATTSGCGVPPGDAEASLSDAGGGEDKALTAASCTNRNTSCAAWASRGECTKNPSYMLTNCCASCNGGGGTTGGTTGGEACQGRNAVLDLRVHLMRNVAMNVQGVRMTTDHITPQDVESTIVPGMNQAWAPANIQFRLQKQNVIEEQVVKGRTYDADIACVQSAVRDGDGRADDARLPCLRRMMRPENMTQGDKLFHVYIFPFTGNTSQGNAMRAYNFHTVLGAFTNKYNGGGVPKKMPLSGFGGIGSLARTAAHEQGHVLGLGHDSCEGSCLMNGSAGSTLASQEVATARAEAQRRSICKP